MLVSCFVFPVLRSRFFVVKPFVCHLRLFKLQPIKSIPQARKTGPPHHPAEGGNARGKQPAISQLTGDSPCCQTLGWDFPPGLSMLLSPRLEKRRGLGS
jgi:hypothetical protein